MHTREILMNLKSKNYTMCFGSLYTLNGLLPEKYQVKVSTIEYKKLTRTALTAICKFCEKPTDYNTLKVYKVLLPIITRTLSGTDYDKVWNCSNCQKMNKLEHTKVLQNVLQEPYFLQVVPKAPERHDGILDRSTFDIKIRQWILQFLSEISHQMGKYRQEYVPKGGEMTDDQIEVESTLEEYLE